MEGFKNEDRIDKFKRTSNTWKQYNWKNQEEIREYAPKLPEWLQTIKMNLILHRNYRPASQVNYPKFIETKCLFNWRWW